MEESLLSFAHATGIFGFMNSAWGWPIVESIHFSGMCLLIGSVGLFDLRLMGLFRDLPLEALHKLVPFGVAGYCLNVSSGILFLSTAPDQYLYNPAFQTKLMFMLVAGLNMMFFYRTTWSSVKGSPEGIELAYRARIMGAVSLLCWSMVIVCGRLITYYRPPYHWCFWC